MERSLLCALLSLILYLSPPIAIADSHSHYFFTTATNDTTYGSPYYFSSGFLDDIMLYWYDSDDEVLERRVPWFQSTFATLLQKSMDEHHFQQVMQRFLQTVWIHANDTEEFPVLQRMEGCTSYDDGSIKTVFGYHYNGSPFLSFSVDDGNWTAEVEQAQRFADFYNGNENLTEQTRNTLLNTCIPHIAELLSLGNCTLSRQETPVMTMTRICMNSTCELSCKAYGHYPKNINMTWYRNGEEIPESDMDRVTLPYPDLTYLTLLSLPISPIDDDVYTCVVSHVSMTLPYMGDWRMSEVLEGRRGFTDGVVIAICLSVILLVTVIIFSSVSVSRISGP
ncbi:major histocompatibility complex class I-related gene protein-like [Hyperolius riggenbachi]|uniref:major histocompatibility complex class I-related gene protein-like n=1 Tax=Hyperolius riggenbachi TaxID=752182 RepID=UPI0035A29E73